MVVNAVNNDNAVQVNTTSVSSQKENNFSSYMNTTSLEDIFNKAAKTYNIDVNLLKAVAKAESDFDAGCTSSCGAMGIMQLMPGTAAELGVKDAYDPEQSIMGGAKYLSKLLDKYDGNVSLALAAYNAGSGNVKKYGGIPPFKETQNYVVKVTKYMQEGVTVPNKTVYTSGTSDYGTTKAAADSKIEMTSSEETAAVNTFQPAQYLLDLIAQNSDDTGIDTQKIKEIEKEMLAEVNAVSEEEADEIFSEEDYEEFLNSYEEEKEAASNAADDAVRIYTQLNGINYSPNVMSLIASTMATAVVPKDE